MLRKTPILFALCLVLAALWTAGVPETALAQGPNVMNVINNRVGVQTETPQETLDVRGFVRTGGADDNALFIIDADDGGALIRFANMLFREDGVDIWELSKDNLNNFRIFRTGVSAPRLQIDNNTSRPFVGIGTGALDHNLEIVDGAACSEIDAGETSFTNCSSRAIKQNLAEVQIADILDKIAAVGVYTFDYVDGPAGRMGLMAEDFHPIFERGPETMLSGHEIQLALWLAVQELTAEVRELKARNQKLEERLAGVTP